MTDRTLVLASASPARLRLLRDAGFDPLVVVSHVDESLVEATEPREVVQELASKKAAVVAEGRTTGGASIRAAALNVDTYRRTADGWKIASRVISPLTAPQMEGFGA